MNFINSLSPDAGPITSLVVAFLSAVMDVLTAFNIFHFNTGQQTAIVTVATASIALGLYIFAILHQQAVNIKLQLRGLRGGPPQASGRGGSVGY